MTESGFTFRVSVQALARFCCQRGDLNPATERSPTAREGQAGHQRLQAQRPPHYQREQAISLEFQGQLCRWTLAGRMDGLAQTAEETLVEEIKTTYCSAATLPPEQQTVHRAQARLYAAMLCQHQDLARVRVQLTYLKLDDDTTFAFDETESRDSLLALLEDCRQQYTRWLDAHCRHLQRRNPALERAGFPFASYRPGQRSLSVALYRALRDGHSGLYHAPTGLGKTLATLFPALKHLGAGTVRQIWYLTAKNSGHNSVRQALSRLNEGLPLRLLYLQARERQCAGCSPDPATPCPARQQYFDRLPAAREAFQLHHRFHEAELAALARKYRLCPHQLSRDLLPWVDLVVADYNYVFDPYSRLVDSSGHPRQIAVLLDEAHNLPERAREMFSEDLALARLTTLRRRVTDAPLKRRLGRLQRTLRAIISEPPAHLTEATVEQLGLTAQAVLDWFSGETWLLFPEELFEAIMGLWRFAQKAHQATTEDALITWEAPPRIELFCTDPAPHLDRVRAELHSCHYFSGSLLPSEFFQRSISRSPLPTQLVLPSPFPPRHQCTLVAPINTRYGQREQSVPRITGLLQALWRLRPGRYLMAAPSYHYLNAIVAPLVAAAELPLLLQPQTRDAAQRQAFLQALAQPAYLAGVIAGGLFAEGIDLEQVKLDGVIIIGTCQPPPSPQRALIHQHYDSDGQRGFDFAYRYPGLNKVIQTAGRLIRSEQDRGLVLLVDDRFCHSGHQALLPAHWQPQIVQNSQDLARCLKAFGRE
ncbi:MAG: helicase C-terminal domain-containing protein [Pseudomonadota bacterium]|nr:helicase C-terminal domain-containing protein [Pseudomonadota bacterium]